MVSNVLVYFYGPFLSRTPLTLILYIHTYLILSPLVSLLWYILFPTGVFYFNSQRQRLCLTFNPCCLVNKHILIFLLDTAGNVFIIKLFSGKLEANTFFIGFNHRNSEMDFRWLNSVLFTVGLKVIVPGVNWEMLYYL